MLKYTAVTAEGVVQEGEAEAIQLPTGDGEITVLENHIPLVSTLKPGVVSIRNGEEVEHVAVSGGFVQTDGVLLTILADTAERADDIDAERAEQARKRAIAAMEEKLEKEEVAELAAALQKNLARLRAAELVKHRRRK
jgi:F-type H+-transporting ATPase subunit epsilon